MIIFKMSESSLLNYKHLVKYFLIKLIKRFILFHFRSEASLAHYDQQQLDDYEHEQMSYVLDGVNQAPGPSSTETVATSINGTQQTQSR